MTATDVHAQTFDRQGWATGAVEPARPSAVNWMTIQFGTSMQPDLESLQLGGQVLGVSRETSVDNDALLRRNGVQVTAQRLAVLRAVSDRPHSAADDIFTVVRADIGAISRQAVYDSLGTLTDKGLLRRIQPAGSSARYENRVGDNHHHLICRNCNRMVDVDCAVGDTPCLTAADDLSYEIDEAEVIYWGRCPECLKSVKKSATKRKERRV